MGKCGGRYEKVCWGVREGLGRGVEKRVGRGEERCGKVCGGEREVRGSVGRDVGKCAGV